MGNDRHGGETKIYNSRQIAHNALTDGAGRRGRRECFQLLAAKPIGS